MASDNRRFFRRRQAKKRVSGMNNLQSLVSNVEDDMQQLYADTYLSSRDGLDSMGSIADKMEDNISQIIHRNNQYDISNISKLYSRLMRQSSGPGKGKTEQELANELEGLFSDNNFADAIMGSYLSNKWIDDLDREIDAILKYVPNIKEALEVLKDAVLSADSTSKDFIFPKVQASDDAELKIITDRISRMEKKYDLPRKVEDWYDGASKYGESFVYRVPYSRAIDKLLKQKNQTNSAANFSMPMLENGVLNESVLFESGKIEDSFSDMKFDTKANFEVEIDTSAILASAINETKTGINSVRKPIVKGLMESYAEDVKDGVAVHEADKLTKIIPSDLEVPEGLNLSKTGSSSTGKKLDDKTSVNVRGCVVKTLDRKNLIRLYVDDSICLGYYYLEFRDKNDLNMAYYMDNERNLGYSKSISTIQKTITANLEDSRVDHLMKTIAKKISDKLDATFVNANQDISKEIYAILKYNDIFNSNQAVRVSYLPPEDVKWLRFREDTENHVGLSDINESIIPAKLLAMLYISYVTGVLTRGQDKRVYYVKQTIETNIAQTLLNVINQIKKSNFNMRAIENLNNLLNITGRFNDYIIPVGPSGDSPIQFEVMPGQQFDINQDLLNLLTESAVNPIVPLELIQMRMNPEFATQYTSSSLKLLRKTYRRQARLQTFISDLYTDIYMAEYEEYQCIECELPPPVFLSMVNTNQLLENTKQYVETIAEMEYEGDTSETAEQEKAIFKRKMINSILASYIKPSEIERCKNAAKFEVSKIKEPTGGGEE